MMYLDFIVGEHTYKLRLNTRNTIELEKKLGCNPIMIFGAEGEEKFPSVAEMMLVLHASLQQFNHGISLDDTYDIFDAWINEGNSINEFIALIVELYKVSGIIKKDAETEKN